MRRMAESYPVSLTIEELRIAAMVGIGRRINGIERNRIETLGTPKEGGWQRDVEGACGEAAVAKWTGRYWQQAGGPGRGADVGRAQVRTTPYANGRLWVRDFDKDNDAFILVTGLAPHFILRGWLYGYECKLKDYHDAPDGRAAFYVPQDRLREMKLPKLMEFAFPI